MNCPNCDCPMVLIGQIADGMDVHECPVCGYQEDLDCLDGR